MLFPLFQIALNNTYAIIREKRPNITVRQLKSEIAQQLSSLVAPNVASEATGEPFGVRGVLTADEISSLRLDHVSVKHTLRMVPNSQRRQCAVHVDRKDTAYYCAACGVHMCLGDCWERFHYHQNYLLFPEASGEEEVVAKKRVKSVLY